MQSTSSPFSEQDLSPEDLRLVLFYQDTGLPVDFLAYTPEFETLFAKLQQSGDTRSKADVFRRLLNLRKAGRLPRVA